MLHIMFGLVVVEEDGENALVVVVDELMPPYFQYSQQVALA